MPRDPPMMSANKISLSCRLVIIFQCFSKISLAFIEFVVLTLLS